LSTKNLAKYNIVVHGVKGASYCIFAREVGDSAKSLEASAKTNDFETVLTEHPGFVQLAEKLLDNIDCALKKLDATISKPTKTRPDTALLQQLRVACAALRQTKLMRL
jgi:hypothetical protein